MRRHVLLIAWQSWKEPNRLVVQLPFTGISQCTNALIQLFKIFSKYGQLHSPAIVAMLFDIFDIPCPVPRLVVTDCVPILVAIVDDFGLAWLAGFLEVHSYRRLFHVCTPILIDFLQHFGIVTHSLLVVIPDGAAVVGHGHRFCPWSSFAWLAPLATASLHCHLYYSILPPQSAAISTTQVARLEITRCHCLPQQSAGRSRQYTSESCHKGWKIVLGCRGDFAAHWSCHDSCCAKMAWACTKMDESLGKDVVVDVFIGAEEEKGEVTTGG